jgi:hypothetical protein
MAFILFLVEVAKVFFEDISQSYLIKDSSNFRSYTFSFKRFYLCHL